MIIYSNTLIMEKFEELKDEKKYILVEKMEINIGDKIGSYEIVEEIGRGATC